jgi:hypothetical protein
MRFRSSGVQEFRSSGVQEFRSSGVQEFRSSGVQEFRSSGVHSPGASGRITSKKGTEQLGNTSIGLDSGSLARSPELLNFCNS